MRILHQSYMQMKDMTVILLYYGWMHMEILMNLQALEHICFMGCQ